MQMKQQPRLKQRLASDSCCLCRTQRKLRWSVEERIEAAVTSVIGEVAAGTSKINSGKLRASAWERGDCAIVEALPELY